MSSPSPLREPPDPPLLARARRLARRLLEETGLDLRGLVVLTEAATGPFALTAPLAALAGAERVIAAAADTPYGPWTVAAAETLAAARAFGVADRVVALPRGEARSRAGEADVVTNLGAVRPIDAALVSALGPGAAVALMWETWEYRTGELDLGACRARGVPVLGTDEGRAGVFPWVASLALKQLWQAGVAVRGSRIALVGDNPFQDEIAPRLAAEGAEIALEADVDDLDALLLLDYPEARDRVVEGGSHPPAVLAAASPGAVIVRYTGSSRVDLAACRGAGLAVWPEREVPEGRMAETLAALGPAPVLRLHGAGLQVAAALSRARRRGATPEEAETEAVRIAPGQRFPEGVG
ncbi:hypothetical protein L6R50_26185 [Myxococcota bacterium]|nr:hypothetical protein [Myxococcota bacterium]